MVFQVISKFFKESASFSLGSFCIILQWQKLEQNNVALVYHAKHFYELLISENERADITTDAIEM